MKDRDPKPIQELAIAEAKAGVDYIDINLGPARKDGGELMEWVVKTVQEVVDTPLYLDTINTEAIEAGLKVYQEQERARPSSIRSWPVRKAWRRNFLSLRNITPGWLRCSGDPRVSRGMRTNGESLPRS